jgi:hypothetical protein
MIGQVCSTNMLAVTVQQVLVEKLLKSDQLLDRDSNLRIIFRQEYTNPGRKIAVAAKFCAVAPHLYVSPVLKFLLSTF